MARYANMSYKRKIRCTHCLAVEKGRLDRKDPKTLDKLGSYFNGKDSPVNTTYARYYFLTKNGPEALCTGCYNEIFTSEYRRPHWEKQTPITMEEYQVAVVMNS